LRCASATENKAFGGFRRHLCAAKSQKTNHHRRILATRPGIDQPMPQRAVRASPHEFDPKTAMVDWTTN
jgi:hypothetical protein